METGNLEMKERVKTVDIGKLNRFQRQYFESVEKRTMLPTDTTYVRKHIKEMIHFAQFSSEDRILEVGCGMGKYTLLLAELGLRIEGLDLSPVLLDRLRNYNHGKHNIPLHCGDILEYSSKLEGQFDAVIGFMVLHHMHDLTQCFQAVSRLLRPGGRAVFLEPNSWNPLFYVQILITPGMSFHGERLISQMRRPVLFDAMRQAGLTRLELKRFGFFPRFLTNLAWGARLESILERVPLWRPLLPFQLIRGDRVPSSS